jgi:ribosomal protein S18 acetylase RimI-like enzyme
VTWTLTPLTPAGREEVRRFIAARWGADFVVAHGQVYYPHELPGQAALQAREIVGLVTWHIAGDACEIVTLDSLQPASGLGTALIAAARSAALAAGCRRLWLITTNDNLTALRFYQKRGFQLAALHRNALAVSRQRKPTIPLVGENGIPLRDEIELEQLLESR